MARVHVSLRIPGTAPLPELIKLIQEVEAAGFDGAGILDSQLLCRDTFVTMALAAAHTSGLMLFPAVTNPLTRHPSVLASAIQTIEEIAPGRGTSGRLAYASGRRIPVLMAASGPKATELAGELADGVLLSVGFHPHIVDAVLNHLAAGARRGGRWLEDLEIVWAVRVGIATTTAEARRQARPTVVHQAFLSPRSHWLPYTGLTLPRLDIPPEVRAIYPDLSHARDWEQAIAATSFVPDDVIAQLCDTFGLVGTAEHCARRIVEMAGVGVTNLYVQAFQTFVGPERELRTFRDEVFPRLKAAGSR
jgi:5,10-methylenetetrahydromethanopterin reductase